MKYLTLLIFINIFLTIKNVIYFGLDQNFMP